MALTRDQVADTVKTSLSAQLNRPKTDFDDETTKLTDIGFQDSASISYFGAYTLERAPYSLPHTDPFVLSQCTTIKCVIDLYAAAAI